MFQLPLGLAAFSLPHLWKRLFPASRARLGNAGKGIVAVLSVIGIALDAGNAVVEIYASSETGTWTLVVTEPGGPSCMIASGHAFEMLAEPLPVLDEGA